MELTQIKLKGFSLINKLGMNLLTLQITGLFSALDLLKSYLM
jgi:hypothetical protein